MTEQWMIGHQPPYLLPLGPGPEITPIEYHELRVDRDGMLVYCPCGWAYTFSYVPAGEDISFAYRAHLEGL